MLPWTVSDALLAEADDGTPPQKRYVRRFTTVHATANNPQKTALCTASIVVVRLLSAAGQ
jgi:hypothetical protein